MIPFAGASAESASARYREIDWLKGFAILCVLSIHANLLVHVALGTYVVNRAVPIFLILFGITSELWWRREVERKGRVALRSWYESRFRRLMPPVWGTVAVWLGLVVLLSHPLVLTPTVIAALALGYLRWIGTGWFVTLILQIIVAYPIIRLAMNRLGAAVMILISVGLVIAARLYPIPIITLMVSIFRHTGPGDGLWYLTIFAPPRLLYVCAGMLIARRILLLPRHWVALCIGLTVLGDSVHANMNSASASEVILAMTDVPLAVALLACVKVVRVWPPAAALLTWCGERSWGLYLGQSLVHDWVHFLGMEPGQMALVYRGAYFACLFVGAVGFVTIGEAVRKVPSWRPTFSARNDGI
ncbi:MAG: acyltransferase family protein [Deltaproteobacteria bacterium]|nr:acyltransferase family protein [Deltaproteobacteria bacterium]